MERWRVAPSFSMRAVTSLRRSMGQFHPYQRRPVSTGSSIAESSLKEAPAAGSQRTNKMSILPPLTLPPLSVMPTSILIRSLLMTYILASPRLVSMSIPIMNRISHSKSWFLNPDKNPILHTIIRKLFYDHFCAGENEREVKQTIATMKKMGFEGVILGYAKETVVDKTANAEEAAGVGLSGPTERVVEEWKEGTLRTLAMLGKDDYLAVKFTGGGSDATEALALGKSPSPSMLQAITAICDQATKQNTRLWIDAELQVFQTAIDSWSTDLMRKYNKNGKVLVYNTFQAYLKETPKNLTKHLKLAQEEGWELGIKLVRGAYIASEPRHLIHDTIEDTHAAYDAIVQSLLTRSFPGVEGAFPKVQLMLASHNAESVQKGFETWKSRNVQGLPTIKMEIGQLQGMADEVSCGLVQMRQQMDSGASAERAWYPRAYKCLCWGGTQECVQFLMRRVIENRGSLERTKFWMTGLKNEMSRRIRAALRLI